MRVLIDQDNIKMLTTNGNYIRQEKYDLLKNKLEEIEKYIKPLIINDGKEHDCCDEEKNFIAIELLEIINKK